jgi:predicted flap endonuclease-1-like 5' DNA nuclease
VKLRLVLAAAALIAAVVLLVLQVPPVPTWFYDLAWWPTLVILDTLVVRQGGESLFARPRVLATMLGWSAVIWLVFEALNFRLQNWYYVFLPAHPIERWVGITLSFATVVPAIFVPERLLDRLGVARDLRTPTLGLRPGHLAIAAALGVALLAAVLAWPRVLYPLTWGAVWLVAEPLLYRSDPERSLLADLARGRPGRIVRLMAAGLFAGALWETFNAAARGKWIYTVPLLEDLKLFEMPPLGFLGFPFFALEVWSLYHLLAPRTRWRTVVPSVAFALLVLAGIDRWTTSSTTPRLAELPGAPAAAVAQLEAARLTDVFRLARSSPEEIARRAALPAEDARTVHEAARLSTLRGIGTRHAARLAAGGITTVEALAEADAGAVWRIAHAGTNGLRPTEAEVRVWIRAAREPAAGRRTTPRPAPR